MDVLEWTVQQILKDSECCGNASRCHWYEKDRHPRFHSCLGVEEVLEVE